MNNFGVTIYHRITDYLCGSRSASKVDKGTISLQDISRYLPSNPIIIEGGAHTGADTVAMANQWPASVIYAFEPIPHLFEQLSRTASSFSNIQPFPFALGQVDGTSKMYVSAGRSDGSSSLLKPKEHLTVHPLVTFGEEITVNVTNLETFAEQNRVPHVDFLWLDLQGSELQALRGARGVLDNVQAIHAEVSLIETYEGAPLYAEIRNWLAQQGFEVAIEALPWKDMGNVLLTRKRA